MEDKGLAVHQVGLPSFEKQGCNKVDDIIPNRIESNIQVFYSLLSNILYLLLPRWLDGVLDDE